MKRKQIIPVIQAGIACCVFSSLNCLSAQALVLVKDGQPRASIIVEENAGDQVQKAAQTLQKYIKESSGARLPLRSTFTDDENIIIVGKTDGVDTSKLDQDGFILQGDGKKYFIAGGSDWGTEFGVYDFLERYLGVRWLMPTALGTDIPRHQTIDVPDTKIVQEPVFLSRQLSPIYIDKDDPLGEWGRFNRARGRIEFHHNLRRLFPTGETNPDFYPEVDGKRLAPTNNRWQPNFAAPGIVDEAVKKLDTYFRKNPTTNSYSLGINDSAVFDESAASRARRNGKINSIGFEDVSDDYYRWVNDVVRKTRQKYPDKWFGLLAYLNVFDPPSFDLDSHVVPFIVEDRARYENAEVRDKAYSITRTWAQKAPSIGWYDWAFGSSYLLPRVYFHRMQDYLSWGVQNHVKFYYAEVYPNWGSGPKVWVLTKLLWNPDQDVDALLDDWYTHFGGAKAAPSLRGFYEVWEEFWRGIYTNGEPTTDDTSGLYRRDPRYLADVPQSSIAKADAFMRAALRDAETAQQKARVAKLQEMWHFFKAGVITYQAEYGVNTAFPSHPHNAGEAGQLLSSISPVLEQARIRRELLDTFKNDPLYGDSADAMSLYAQTNGSHWGYSAMWRVLPYVKSSPQLQAQLQQMTKSTFADIAEQSRLILRAAEGKIMPMTTNNSFENGLKGWNIWDKGAESDKVRQSQYDTSADVAQSGKQSMKIQSAENAALTKTIRCKPGKYFARVSCYVPTLPKSGDVTVELQAMANTKTRRVNRGEIRLPGSHLDLKAGEWVTAIIPFTIPAVSQSEGDGVEVKFVLGMKDFAVDEIIYLDDVGMYRVEE